MSEDSNDDEGDTGGESPLDLTLESFLEDAPTQALSAKTRKPLPAFDTLPRSVPRPPSVRRPLPSGLTGEPRPPTRTAPPSSRPPPAAPESMRSAGPTLGAALPTAPRMPSAPPIPRSVLPTPSAPPIPRSAPPRPSALPGTSTPPTTSVPPLPSFPPLSSLPPSSSPPPSALPPLPPLTSSVLAELYVEPAPREPLAGVADDAPTIPGALAMEPRSDGEQKPTEDELELELVSTLGPPGIPLLVNPPGLDHLDEKKRKSPAKRKRAGKKGKRPTVRIPDDQVPMAALDADGDERESAPPASTADDVRDVLRDSLPPDPFEGMAGTPDETPTAPASLEAVPLPPSQPLAPQPLAPQALAPQALAPQPLAPQVEATAMGGVPRGTSAPIVDDQAIVMMRPIEVVSDMPPVPSASQPGLDDGGYDGIEEIEPERMSLPGNLMSTGYRGEAKPPPLPPTRIVPAAPPSSPGTAKPAAATPPVTTAPPTVEAPPLRPAAQADAKAPTKPKRAWWSELFEDDMVRTLDNPKQRDVEREASFIEQSFQLPPGARLLDLACGHGVHAVELASRGYQVVAVDLSTTMLALGRAYNEKRSQAVSFVQGDMRQVELDAVFEGIYCWGASFGYFDDATNIDVLARMTRALKPGGKLLLDLTNRDFVTPRSPSTAWFHKPGCVCMDEVRYDFLTSRLHAKRMVIFESGRAREVEYAIRLYTAHELGLMLQQVGLRVTEVSGHRAHRGAYFGNESPRLIMLAEKI